MASARLSEAMFALICRGSRKSEASQPLWHASKNPLLVVCCELELSKCQTARNCVTFMISGQRVVGEGSPHSIYPICRHADALSVAVLAISLLFIACMMAQMFKS